ncbi:MAG: hypothetical protein ACLPX5_03480 [Dissulfurispiraceae bacterium]
MHERVAQISRDQPHALHGLIGSQLTGLMIQLASELADFLRGALDIDDVIRNRKGCARFPVS